MKTRIPSENFCFYDQLNKEFNIKRELFIKIIQCNKYFQFYNHLNNDDWDDDHIPFPTMIAINGYDALFRGDIVRCQLTDVSFDSLLLTVDQFIKKSLESIDKWYKKNNQEGEMDNVTTTIMNESKQFFELFNENPSKMDINDLKHCLRLFCSINAHEIVRRFCNKHPDLVDFSFLLPEALASLNLDTVKVLVNAGADVNRNIMLYRDQDMDATIFGPPIFYPLLALLFGPVVFLRFPPIECGNIFRPDHPKLIDIMMYLLNSGANLELSPIRFPWEVLELDLNREDIEILSNFKNFAKQINVGIEEIKVFSKTFQDFLQNIESSLPTTKFNKPPASLDEIKSFIQFVKTQMGDDNSNNNEAPTFTK